MEPVLVSACLAGAPCRYNARSKASDEVTDLVRRGGAVAVCPEVVGGLGVPRRPAEIVGGDGDDVLDGRARVVDDCGNDVTDAFLSGAERALDLARRAGAKTAVLTDRSPSCGSREIYDGTFGGTRRPGIGVTAALLARHGIEVRSDSG
ncbi:MAG: DUF523 domain-containing protein [Streptosporangiales bacterium]|nr:DUF523 domain-containing protein [Streptosporangiales bacterium]